MTIKFILGIDPGKTGAIAILAKDKHICHIFDWEDAESADNLIKMYAHQGNCFAILEKVHSMPKQGVKSVWTFAEQYGILKGLLTANKIPYQLVTPQRWMKGQIMPSDHEKIKKRSLAVCRRLYPDSKWFKLEKHHGRADATLIARHGIIAGLI